MAERRLLADLPRLAVLSAAAALVLLPYLEQVCVGNRREFLGMVSFISPLARQASWVIPAVALAGVLAARLRRPRLAVAAYGVLAVAIAGFTFQTMVVLTPLMSDQAAGEYIRRVASPQDLLIMGPIEEFEYGASLEYYARRHILMVKRHGLPQFPYPVDPASDYIIRRSPSADLRSASQRTRGRYHSGPAVGISGIRTSRCSPECRCSRLI